MRSAVTRAAFRHRDSAVAGVVIRQAFAHASRVLPVRRVAESDHVLAFHHPVPGFQPVHLLLVPKFSARSLTYLATDQREQLSAEIEVVVPEALDKTNAAGDGFVVLVNGGSRQDVAQVHFHLLTGGYRIARPLSAAPNGTWTDVTPPSCETHRVRFGEHPLRAGLEYAAEVHTALGLEVVGYSVVWDARDRAAGGVVHLTAGPASVW